MRSIAAACLIVVTLAVTAVGCGGSDDTTTVKTVASTTTTAPQATPAVPVTEQVNQQQLEQRDSVLGAISRFWETDPGQLELWKERAQEACEYTYDLEVEYQDATIQAFIEEHCTPT